MKKIFLIFVFLVVLSLLMFLVNSSKNKNIAPSFVDGERSVLVDEENPKLDSSESAIPSAPVPEQADSKSPESITQDSKEPPSAPEEVVSTKVEPKSSLPVVTGKSVTTLTEPKLKIHQLSIGLVKQVQSNDKDITFLKFHARAEGGDILLHGITFMDGDGRFTDADTFALWMDTDDDNKVDTKLDQTLSEVQMNNLPITDIDGTGLYLLKDELVYFELRGDAVDLVQDFDGNKMMFPAFAGIDYITASDARTGEMLVGILTDGSIRTGCAGSACDIVVNTAPLLMVTLFDKEG